MVQDLTPLEKGPNTGGSAEGWVLVLLHPASLSFSTLPFLFSSGFYWELKLPAASHSSLTNKVAFEYDSYIHKRTRAKWQS